MVLVKDNNVVKEDNDPLVDFFSSDIDPFKPGILSKLIFFIFLHLLYHLPFLDFIYRVSREHDRWLRDDLKQGCNVRKVNCCHVYSAAEFVNKNRCISVCLVSEEVKSIKFS